MSLSGPHGLQSTVDEVPLVVEGVSALHVPKRGKSFVLLFFVTLCYELVVHLNTVVV